MRSLVLAAKDPYCCMDLALFPKEKTPMRPITPGIFLLALGLAVMPAAAADAPVPASWQTAVAKTAAAACGSSSSGCFVSAASRRQLTPKVAEYSFRLRTGPGELDRIGLHRVVRETAPFRPAPTGPALMMAHGDVWGFDAAFLASVDSPVVPDDRALPIFLAQKGVDVWGIDFGWTLVPASTDDFSAFAGWGLERDARDLGIALTVARGVRALTGEGLGRLHLLGWSRGGQIGYAYMNAETELPPALRHVASFIPVDIFLKTDVEPLREAACVRADVAENQIADGIFENRTGILASTAGQLAKAAPADPSPLVPGLTNRQTALLLGAATFSLFPPDQQIVPVYHFTAGTFDGLGLPSGLIFTEEPYWFDFLTGAAPFQPEQEIADGDLAICDVVDVPFDDHLDDIVAPVLYVGAGGGFGEFGVYTTTLLGSPEVETLLVDLEPDPAARLFDFGHADLFTAASARTLVWQPILDWLRAH